MGPDQGMSDYDKYQMADSHIQEKQRRISAFKLAMRVCHLIPHKTTEEIAEGILRGTEKGTVLFKKLFD